jgi:hypothetical protein
MNNFLFKNAAPVVASDTANIPNLSLQSGLDNRGCFLYIGVSLATIRVRTAAGQDVTFKAPAIGRVLPVSVVRVFVTGSSTIAANDVIALWN